MRKLRSRFWLESATASVCGMLVLVTLVWPDWVEAATGFSPDRHDGSFEWQLSGALAVACLLALFAGAVEWRGGRPRVSCGV
jgi:hypothetical protein